MGRILIGNVRHQLANNLTTNENGKYALDANQGKILDDKKINVSDISNNAITTVPNKVLDARMGKTLMDKYDELNRNINRSTYISVPKDAAVNVIFAVSVQSGRCPIVIYGTAAGTIPFAFMVPFNNPTSTLTSLEKVYMIKDSSLDLLNLSIIAESGNYRMKFVNNTGNGLDMYITIGHTSAQVIKVS